MLSLGKPLLFGRVGNVKPFHPTETMSHCFINATPVEDVLCSRLLTRMACGSPSVMRGVPVDQLLGGPRGHPVRGTLERLPPPRSQLCGSHSSSFSSLLSSESQKERGRNRRRGWKEDRHRVVQRGNDEGKRERAQRKGKKKGTEWYGG